LSPITPEEGSVERGRNVGKKNIGILSRRRGIRKWWAEAPGLPKRGVKCFKKICLERMRRGIGKRWAKAPGVSEKSPPKF
jgi:hypothetical protein